MLNLDEAGFNHNETGKFVIVPRGSRNVHRVTDADRSRHSYVSCIAGDGSAAPAFIIEPGGKRTSLTGFLFGCPAGWSSACAPSGYMTAKTMLQFVQHLQRWDKLSSRATNEWSLLLMDGYSSHTLDPDVLQAFADLRLYCLSFPSHTTAELQPCDVGIFGPLKRAIAAAMDEFRRAHNNPHVPTSEFARILSTVWDQVHKPDTIISSFRYGHVHVRFCFICCVVRVAFGRSTRTGSSSTRKSSRFHAVLEMKRERRSQLPRRSCGQRL